MTVNLSCGQCKCIRPFSGTPPTCDVCGWVCTPASREDLVRPEGNYRQVNPGTSYKSNPIGEMLGGVAGCLFALLLLAFYAGCALVVIAAMVWAWHYLFG